MKIALCLSGHTRSYKKTYNYWYENVLKKYNPDVFISTWDGSGVIGGCCFALLHIQDAFKPKNDLEFGKIDSKIDADNLKEKFKPKGIVIDNPSDEHINQVRSRFEGNLDGSGQKIDSIALMYYKIFDANNLKKAYELENNFKYDIVIRSRFDLAMTKLNLDVPMDIMHIKVRNKIVYGVHDTIFFSNSDNMDKASDTFKFLTPPYLSSRINGDMILRETMEREGIQFHHCMDFSYLFVKPPMVIEYDTEQPVMPYDDFTGEIVK